MNKYDELVKQAENYLRKCKACCTCKNATMTTEGYYNINYHCSVYNKDVSRHCEFMCEHYKEA